jgi:hypothetical protein
LALFRTKDYFAPRLKSTQEQTKNISAPIEGVRILFWENDVARKEAVAKGIGTVAFPADVFGPVEWRAFAWLAVFCRSLVTISIFRRYC